MSGSRIATVFVACGGLWITPRLLADTDMPDRRQIRAAASEVDEARDKLKDLSREIDDLQKEVSRADAARKQGLQKLQSLRDDLEKEHADQIRIAAAREDHMNARHALDDASRPVLKTLHADKKFIDATWQAKTARTRIGEVQRDKVMDPTEQRKLLADLTAKTLLPDQMERTALAGNPAIQAARTAVDRAANRLASANRRIDEELERDPEYRKGQRSAEIARVALATAKEQLAEKQHRYVQARQRLSREESQLVQVKLRHQIEAERKRRNRDRDRK